MFGHRFSTEQIIQIIHQVETGQLTMTVACRKHKITEDTFHRWLYTYGERSTPAQRIQMLEQENAQLRRQLDRRS